MTLRDLVTGLGPLAAASRLDDVNTAALAQPVSAVEHDSRRVAPGAVFVALKGEHSDGAIFAPQAVARGAIAVLAESTAPEPLDIPWIVVSDARLALAQCAAAFYGHPSDELTVVGITGTNGKTTVSYLVASIFDEAGQRCGRIGTVGYRIGLVEYDATRTTPEAVDLQRMLREMVDARCAACAMEVSSHALVLRRVDGLRFAAGVFTNLTRDHLDFHRGMEEYFLAKRRLFDLLPPGAPAVVNADDAYGARLLRERPGAISYGIDRAAQVRVVDLAMTIHGVSGTLETPAGRIRLQSSLVGRPNVSNILAAAAACCALDVPPAAIAQGITALGSVPGRFQTASSNSDDIAVVVDYAHTDDALRSLLETARPLARGRLITVFGCGGDRDRTKRPLMGAVAARLSDRVVLTSDNPRSEDPLQIIEEIKRGLVPPDRPAVRHGQPVAAVRAVPWVAIADRREAIDLAIREAEPGDLVVVAGKGHEKTQVIGSRALPFDDVFVAREALHARRRSMAGGGGQL
jgi:UDP-N-acetylmuramoyl-L-alanyl-D-glutamate--2,6-diaminopimelate ligase